MVSNVPYAAAPFPAREMPETFTPFSATHAAVVVSFGVALTVLVACRRRLRRAGEPSAERFDRAVAVAAGMVAVLAIGWPLLPRHFRLDWSLPLHVCDFATLTAPLAVATRYRRARALLYFWGIGLCTQGFITPDLQDGPARVGFWTFWLAHFSVVGVPLYDVAARGYRPDWRDYWFMVAVSLVYVAVILPLDLWLGVNYGYIGRGTPGHPTLVDALGPWPWRVAIMVLLGCAAMALLMVPWTLVATRRSRPAGSAGTAAGKAAGSG